MTYKPIDDSNKQQWIDWLNSQVQVLNGQPETKENQIFSTPEGDVATAKDLVGNMLALITGSDVTIN